MRVYKKILISCIAITIFVFNIFSDIGIGTKFATVVFENLQPGGIYNLRVVRNLPLVVFNSGTDEADVMVEIEPVEKTELKEGYESIPDVTWIKIVPNRFKLKAGESMPCDVILEIPNDKTLVGRHFQAKIWSHTVGEDTFGAGVVNRLFFSVGTMGPEAVRKAKKKEILVSFNFDIEPREIYITVPAGKKVNLLKEFDKSIKLINKSRKEIEVKLESVHNQRGENVISQIPPKYEFTPDIKFLSFNPEKVKVKGNFIEDAKLFLHIPDEEKFYDKNFMFLTKIYPVKPELPVEFYAKILVMVKKLEKRR